MQDLKRPHHPELPDDAWRHNIELGMRQLLMTDELAATTAAEHFERTPERVAKALLEMVQGCFQNPDATLGTTFTARTREMVALRDMDFVSLCAHHFLPFYGKVHFGYIPNDRIVGLSKIPRLIKVLATRPQIQEELTAQIADTFERVVQPQGTIVVMDAVHTCMLVRGVKQYANTRTSAVRGLFLKEPGTVAEFMAGINGHR